MDLQPALLEQERAFWRAAGDAAAYESALAPDAVHVFPGMGVVGRPDVLAGVAGAEPWESFEIEDPSVVELGDGAAALVYTARAKRANAGTYTAAISSAYRRNADGWELVLHQQTPLEAP